MNTNIYNRSKYVEKIVPIRNDDDRMSCYMLLTHLIYHHTKDSVTNIVCFSLLSLQKHTLDILLLCAKNNEERLGNMASYSIFSFAVRKKCKRMYAEPRTESLRITFIKYGFEHLRGVKDINEVLVKYIKPVIISRVNRTLKKKRINLPNLHDYQSYNI